MILGKTHIFSKAHMYIFLSKPTYQCLEPFETNYAKPRVCPRSEDHIRPAQGKKVQGGPPAKI